MTDIITALISVFATFVVVGVKPEWFIGWLLKLLNSKMPSQANKISNVLGLKMIQTGAYAIKDKPDSDKMNEAVNEIEEKAEMIEDELKKL